MKPIYLIFIITSSLYTLTFSSDSNVSTSRNRTIPFSQRNSSAIQATSLVQNYHMVALDAELTCLESEFIAIQANLMVEEIDHRTKIQALFLNDTEPTSSIHTYKADKLAAKAHYDFIQTRMTAVLRKDLAHFVSTIHDNTAAEDVPASRAACTDALNIAHCNLTETFHGYIKTARDDLSIADMKVKNATEALSNAKRISSIAKHDVNQAEVYLGGALLRTPNDSRAISNALIVLHTKNVDDKIFAKKEREAEFTLELAQYSANLEQENYYFITNNIMQAINTAFDIHPIA